MSLALGVLGAACGDGAPPAGPTPQSGASTIVRLEVAAPPRIAPGESVQATATFIKADGSRESAIGRVSWSSDALSTLSVNQAGVVRGETPGEATIHAMFQSFRAQAQMLVLPPGTFKLGGVVTDGGLGIGDAVVTVVSGAGEGQTVKSGSDGAFAIFGVGGRVRIGVTKHGYSSRFADVEVNDHQSLDVRLDPDLSTTTGNWALTLTAGSCTSWSFGVLPADKRTRTYDVRVVEEPLVHPSTPFEFGFSMTLSGGDFIIVNDAGNRLRGFRGRQDQVMINFSVDFYSAYYYQIFERLTPDTALAITGLLTTRKTTSAIEGQFEGDFLIVRDPPNGPIEVKCFSPAHRFTMRRR